jgi:hypothetical protein
VLDYEFVMTYVMVVLPATFGVEAASQREGAENGAPTLENERAQKNGTDRWACGPVRGGYRGDSPVASLGRGSGKSNESVGSGQIIANKRQSRCGHSAAANFVSAVGRSN